MYEGKRAEGEILDTPSASIELVWPDSIERPNRLYFGDNLGVLAELARDNTLHGRVKLVYIDPPYATGGVFQCRGQRDAYDDCLTGPAFIEALRQRLVLIREVLAEDGSIYVHLDNIMAFGVKLVMDEVFGPNNFRNWITRKKCNPKNYTTKTYGNVADYLLFYSRSERFIWNRPIERWTDERAAKEYEYIDAKGRYKKVPVHAPGVRNGETGKPWRGMVPPPGKHWQYRPSELDEMDKRGEIYWSQNGNPRRKVYLAESEGVAVQDIWMDFKDAHNQNIRITGFPTEKNPAVLRRIIEASSNPGDIVLDCFAGSGTTLAVAGEVGRKWIGVDNSLHALATMVRRLAHGTEPMGDFVGKRSRPSAVQRSLRLGAAGNDPVDFSLFTADATLPVARLPATLEDLATALNAHVQKSAG